MVTAEDGLVAGFESPPSPLSAQQVSADRSGWVTTSPAKEPWWAPVPNGTAPSRTPRPPLFSSAIPRTITRSMVMSYLSKWFNTKKTPQSAAIPGSSQVPNSAGGFAFAVDDWARLDRFLILGSEGGSYYATERRLTRENA